MTPNTRVDIADLSGHPLGYILGLSGPHLANAVEVTPRAAGWRGRARVCATPLSHVAARVWFLEEVSVVECLLHLRAQRLCRLLLLVFTLRRKSSCELRFPQRKDLCGIPQSHGLFCLW